MRRNAIFLLLALILFAALAATYFCHVQRSDTQARGIENNQIGYLKRVEYNGSTYVEKTGITTILLLGVDDNDISIDYGARRGGQADFQLLLVVDHENHCVYQLQIDRDTITDVEALGIFGNSLGKQPMQICLAHAFGITEEECDLHAVQAVEDLLPGLKVDIYLTFDLASIGLFNDAIGGTTVTLADDFTSLDPAMAKDTTLTLNGRQAEIFVRTRMEIGDGTNASRMQRHRAFLTAAVDKITVLAHEDVNFLDSLLDTLDNDMTSNVGRGRILNEANMAFNYRIMPMETLKGIHLIGKDGFMEFHLEENAANDWVIRVLYEPCK